MPNELVKLSLSQLGIPAILGVLLLYYAVKLLIFQDVEAIRPPQWKPLRPEQRSAYAREAGLLLLLFGVCTAIASVLMLFIPLLGLCFLTLSIFGVFYRFRRMEEKYTG